MQIPEYISKAEVQRVCRELGIRDWTALTAAEVTLDEARAIQAAVGAEAGQISAAELKQVDVMNVVLGEVADSVDEVWIESKPAGFALHTRLATEFTDVQYYFAYPPLDLYGWSRWKDGRLVRVSLTTTGRRKIEQLFPRFNAEEVALTTHLEPEQQEQLASLLRSMLRRVGDGE